MSSALANRDFRWLVSGSLFSYLCQWIQQATLGWVVYDLTGSGTMLGAVLGIRAIPMLLVSPIAGVAADRFDHKKLLLFSQITSAMVSAWFGAALALDWVRTWHLFAFVLLSGAAAVLDRPARMTTMFELVPRGLAMNAVAINSIGMSLTRIIGPAFAGYLIAWFGAGGNFLIQGALYLISGVLALMVVFPKRFTPARKTTAWNDLTEGLRYAASDGNTRLLVLMGVIPFFLVVPTWGTILPVFAKDVFAAGPQGLGILLTAVGIGGMFGSWISAMLARFDRYGRVQVGSLLVMCAALFGLALSPSLPVSLVFLVVGGAAEMVLVTSNQIMLQMSAPEAMRGRVSSLIQLYPAVISLGAMIAGVLIDLSGARGATALLAAVAGVSVLVLYARSPRLRRMRLSEFR